jgi:hypothetical protein
MKTLAEVIWKDMKFNSHLSGTGSGADLDDPEFGTDGLDTNCLEICCVAVPPPPDPPTSQLGCP